MKKVFTIALAFLMVSLAKAQNVGIGTSAPSQKLDVNGWIKLGDETAPVPPNTHTEGSIRYNSSSKSVEFNNGGTSDNWKALATQSYAVPKGAIVMWSGSFDSIPAGWVLCDGTSGTPDLRNKFVLGATVSGDVGTTGGSHNHTLTISELPSHTHTGTSNSSGVSLSFTGTSATITPSATFNGTAATISPTATFAGTPTNISPTASFTGTPATITPTASFSGTGATINHTASFTGTSATISHTATFTGTGATISHTASFSGTNVTITPSATFSGGVTDAQGSGQCGNVLWDDAASYYASGVLSLTGGTRSRSWGGTGGDAMRRLNIASHTHNVSGNVNVTGASYTPAGTVSVVGASYTPVGSVSVANASYTPAGSVSVTGASYTPAGTVSVTGASYTPAGNVIVNGAAYTPSGAVTVTGASYTPAGTVSVTGASYTPAGTVSGGSHTHTFTTDATGLGNSIDIRPAYFSLAFIMKQ